ncbi:uncharacterized protein Tco025E_08842 [Trypanosoma conorhini]|uniref:THUMP domain-containing protein n=1 Tax=Trypanosoma conorhini TaxID=83891 RepID=A0A422N442_9TRYP|nr:uncharacterized protein Tco025E_08842 [Trypanosoma conorhini]RNF00253.1 hypothetical protein Tco025E_08842 [Trypanosoma conorhini]
MPANATYRQGAGRQRHHRQRLGRMLVPHGRVSGLLFTVNPRQESRALRELQLYLQPLVADLEAAADGAGGGKTGTPEEPKRRGHGAAPATIAPSTSSLLAAELAEYVSAGAGRSRVEDAASDTTSDGDKDNTENKTNNNGSGGDGSQGSDAGRSPARKRRRREAEALQRTVPNCRRWLAPLETGCKGHLMVSIPFPPAAAAETEAESESESGSATAEAPLELEAQGTAAAEPQGQRPPPHSITHNPLVRAVVERIFNDLQENPRPLLRNCFRLMPCELTCCPTLPEMRVALEQLVAAHFPHAEDPRRLHRVSLSFKVKNNTGVEHKKAYFHAALETAFPANRFVVVPAARIKSCGGGVEAVFCALVAHATCAMGVQRLFSERGEYNLHALGAKHLELSSSV